MARNARRDSDRVRAAIALLGYALRGLRDADVLHMLTVRLRQLDAADALLRALGVDVLDQRQEALQAVLLDRKEKR